MISFDNKIIWIDLNISFRSKRKNISLIFDPYTFSSRCYKNIDDQSASSSEVASINHQMKAKAWKQTAIYQKIKKLQVIREKRGSIQKEPIF